MAQKPEEIAVPLFDAEEWIERLDLSEYDIKRYAGMRRSVYAVATELFRRNAAQIQDLGPAAPCDAFIMAYGEPPRRDVTKIGGTPYRPAGKPWPLSRSGEPMIFVAQYRFTESADLVPRLPGDILLLFVEEFPLVLDDNGACLQFEWYPLGLSDLVSPHAVPPCPVTFVCCHGYRWRTRDFSDPECERIFEKALGEVPNNWCELYKHELDMQAIRIFDNAKIGGIPNWTNFEDEEIPRGNFLCALGPVAPFALEPYPWLNHPEPISVSESFQRDQKFNWYDGFILNVFITDDGEMKWYMQ